MQKRGIKWIFNEDFCYYSKTQYFNKLKKLEILPLSFKFDLNDLIIFHRIFYQPTSFLTLPEYLHQKNRPDPLTTCYTRSMTVSDNLQFDCKIRPRIDTFKYSYFYRSSKIWNQLPLNIREIRDLESFKTKLKEYLWIKAEEIYEKSTS